MDKINLDSQSVDIACSISYTERLNTTQVEFNELFRFNGKALLDVKFSLVYRQMVSLLNVENIKKIECHGNKCGLYIILDSELVPLRFNKSELTCREVLEEVRKTKRKSR